MGLSNPSYFITTKNKKNTENPIIVPFDLNTARKIKSGEIEGSVLINNIEIEFVYESKDCAGPYNLLFVRKDGYGISAIYANTIEYIQKCKCGAVTIRFDNSASNSMFWETFEKLDLDTGDATWLHQSYCCDHCVNHWGIGLCGCGSGQKVGKCECGSQKAHDILGVKYDSFGVILKNFG